MSKMEGIAVKLPLSYSNEDGPYTLNKTLGENVKQNFRNLILTVPGERIMLPEFGVGLYQMLFEPMAGKTYQEITTRIYEQTERYMPFWFEKYSKVKYWPWVYCDVTKIKN